jgi:hypothetical protein
MSEEEEADHVPKRFRRSILLSDVGDRRRSVCLVGHVDREPKRLPARPFLHGARPARDSDSSRLQAPLPSRSDFLSVRRLLPIERRTFLHGFRIPGGILLLAAATPLVCRFLGLDRRRFIDTVIPMAALALVFIRIGCFLNGCCFGKLTGLPWGVSFPAGSLVYAYQVDHGWLSSSASWSLSVHPLQLYLCLAALAILAILVLAKGHGDPGMRQLAFYALFFGSTAALEPMRANFLILNNILAPAAAIVTAGWLIGCWMRAPQTNDSLAMSTEGIR